MELRLELKRGDRVQVQTDLGGRIYHLAFPVPKETLNLVISGRSCAVTAKKFTKKREESAELLFCSLNLLLFSDVAVAFVGS